MSLDAVMRRILADRAFYRNSGGGVTFSGGEPLLQADFLEAALARCGSEGIHRAVSTCGDARPEDLARIEPLTDLFLFDIKIVDSALHKAATGADNGRILGNLRWLAARRPADIVVRTPLIPGLTDGPENLSAVEALLGGLGIRRWLRLPFHELGIPKYAQLGLGYRGPLAGC
jgi:pyruvate formate lyase activating enzyme